MRRGSPLIFLCSLILTIFAVFSCTSCANQASYAGQDRIQQVLQKKEISIGVIDSGLGGLSIIAEAVSRMHAEQSYQRVSFIFFNSLFPYPGGYSGLTSRKEKIKIFNNALYAMKERYSPDIILIGCSTLSDLFQDTLFSHKSSSPVVGILDAGVALISEKLKSLPDSRVIVFGNEEETFADVYKKRLLKKGFLDERILTYACPELISFIEKDYDSSETEMLIYAFVDEALQDLNGGTLPFYVCYSCSYYGYAQSIWEKAFEEIGRGPLGYLNPNPRLVDFLFPLEKLDRFPEIQIDVRVVSMVDIPEETKQSLSRIWEAVSPATAAALRHCRVIPDLFEWEKFVGREQE